MAYQITPVWASYVNSGTIPAAWPASFRYALQSVWVNAAVGGSIFKQSVIGSDSVFHLPTDLLNYRGYTMEWTLGGLLIVNVCDGQSYGSPQIFNMGNVGFDASSLIPGTWYNLLLSIDSMGHTVQVYANDVALPITGQTWYAANEMVNPIGNNGGSVFVNTSGPGSPADACIADAWWATPAAFYDLSITANRRAFVTSGGFPVDLGANGQLPLGAPPLVFMTVPPGGLASQFGTNLGSAGGSFTVSGPDILCVSGPYPSSGATPTASIADLWFGPTRSFFDLGAVANRRKLITAAGATPSLATDGSLVTGAPPAVFFSVLSGAGANTFAANKGSGGAFTLSGALAAAGSRPACGDTEQIVPGYAANVPQGADPQIILSVSDDGGRTWAPLQKARSLGKLGEYTKRLRWLKMGQFRQRVIRLEITDPVRRNIIGFYEEISEGME